MNFRFLIADFRFAKMARSGGMPPSTSGSMAFPRGQGRHKGVFAKRSHFEIAELPAAERVNETMKLKVLQKTKPFQFPICDCRFGIWEGKRRSCRFYPIALGADLAGGKWCYPKQPTAAGF